ncbi:inorganic phosphate transporter [Desulfonauticus submarinus]
MTVFDVFFYLSFVAGFLMAFNLGANDVANSMASAVGAKAITVKQALFIAGILNIAGAVLLGSQVTATISKGIIDPSSISDPKLIMLGMFASLISAGFWILISTLSGLPVSSTHSIVGGIFGFGLVVGGPNVVNWGKMGSVVLSWIISPFFAALIGFLVFSHIRKYIFFKKEYLENAKKWAPRWIGLTFAIICGSFLYKTPLGKKLHLPWYEAIAVVFVLGITFWLIGKIIVKKVFSHLEKSAESVEEIFRKLQILTSCYMALSHGANDVANAIGPVAAVYMIAKYHVFSAKAEIPLYFLLFGGVGIALGIFWLGRRVIATVGEKITTLTNTRGFAVDFGAATTVLLASNLGLPVSTTHAAVGSVIGVGLARGFSAVNFKILWKIFLYWILTVPFAALTTIIFFQVLKWMVY